MTEPTLDERIEKLREYSKMPMHIVVPDLLRALASIVPDLLRALAIIDELRKENLSIAGCYVGEVQ